MSILVDNDTRVVVQGITGGEGKFHTGQMMEYGTNATEGMEILNEDLVTVEHTLEDAVQRAVSYAEEEEE